mmetsp:Transcript_18452/g.55684  ORF Transcript_18452/g.55684 Transcript_18452/m.55684 type:complete len:344 (-) Transcript_18452:1403-2434(-)
MTSGAVTLPNPPIATRTLQPSAQIATSPTPRPRLRPVVEAPNVTVEAHQRMAAVIDQGRRVCFCVAARTEEAALDGCDRRVAHIRGCVLHRRLLVVTRVVVVLAAQICHLRHPRTSMRNLVLQGDVGQAVQEVDEDAAPHEHAPLLVWQAAWAALGLWAGNGTEQKHVEDDGACWDPRHEGYTEAHWLVGLFEEHEHSVADEPQGAGYHQTHPPKTQLIVDCQRKGGGCVPEKDEDGQVGAVDPGGVVVAEQDAVGNHVEREQRADGHQVEQVIEGRQERNDGRNEAQYGCSEERCLNLLVYPAKNGPDEVLAAQSADGASHRQQPNHGARHDAQQRPQRHNV